MSEQKNQNWDQKNKKALNSYAKYTSIAFQMIVIVLIGVFGGIKLDQLVTKVKFPIFTLVFSVLSVFFATYYAMRDFIKPKK